MTAIRPYVAIVSARFRMLLQYRAAALAGLWTQIFFGMVLITIYESFYRSTAAVQPMTLAQLVSYVWLGQALLAMLPWNADPELRAMINTGAVAYELCKPVDLYSYWYARAIATRTAPTLLRAVPMTIFSMLVLPLIGLPEWRMLPPASAGAGVAFSCAIICALLLGCALTTLINISLLWTIAGDGIVMLATASVSFFSGMLIPLPLFPDWARTIVQWLPFAGLVDLPFRLYTGNIPPTDLLPVLVRQLLWTALIILIGRRALWSAVHRIVVQGG
jgi:ABC-2 type transport system permease protein